MKRLVFFVYVDFGQEKAKVLKSHYAPGVNEHIVKLIVEAPDPTPMSVVTVQVPALVTVGEVQTIEAQGINQALVEGWVAPTGTLDKDGKLQLEFTCKGLTWLLNLSDAEWVTRRDYGLGSVHYPQWYWDMSQEERENIRQGVEMEEDTDKEEAL